MEDVRLLLYTRLEVEYMLLGFIDTVSPWKALVMLIRDSGFLTLHVLMVDTYPNNVVWRISSSSASLALHSLTARRISPLI